MIIPTIFFIIAIIINFYCFCKAGSIGAKYGVGYIVTRRELEELNNPDLLRELRKNRRICDIYGALFLVLFFVSALLGLP